MIQKLTIAGTVLVATTVVTAEEPPAKELNRWEKRLRDKNLTAKQRVAYDQFAKLHTVTLFQWDERGTLKMPSFDPESKVPTDVLHRMGVDALPFLAEALDDETPTATVTTNSKGGMVRRHVWQVNELAARLVWLIADRDFILGEPNMEVSVRDVGAHPKLAPEFHKLVVDWHAKFAAKTPTERKLADVTDPLFRNRFDAIIWLGEDRAKEGRRAIEARIDGYYDDPKRSLDSTSRSEMTYCALALGQIGDKASLPQVRRVCEDMSYTVYMAYRPTNGWGVGSGMNADLFRAYRGLTLLGKKDEAVKELNRLLTEYGPKMDETKRKEFEQHLAEAKGF